MGLRCNEANSDLVCTSYCFRQPFDVIMLIIGVIAVFHIRSELLPQFALDQVSVKVEWEGASPAEVEEGVCIKIEEALTGVEGVNKNHFDCL